MEPEATQIEQGAEVQQETSNTGNDDAALLSAFLAQEDHSHDGVEAASSDIPAGQDANPSQTVEEFTVKINGVEQTVSRDKLIEHYQKGEASNQKFEEAANLRREADQLKAATTQQQTQLQNAINHFTEQAQRWAAEGQPDWANLLENNPHEYLRQKEIFNARQEEWSKAQAAQAYLNQQNQSSQQEYLTKHLEAESAKLIELMPEWKDAAVKDRDGADLVKYLTDQGYTREEMNNLNNSKASNIKLVVNAMKYEKLVAQAKASAKRVESLPPRIERPGVANNGAAGRAEVMGRLSKTGSIADATEAFSALFG